MKASQPDLLLNETTDGDVGVALSLSLEALGAEEQRSKQDCRSGSHRQARRLHHWRGVLWGGAAVPAAAVRVDEEMKAVLKPTDYEHHQSSGNQIRWRNTAQWARNQMVNDDGRMKKGSRNGYWEISDKGRAWLKKPGPRV